MYRILILFALLLWFGCETPEQTAKSPKRPPNILFAIADDQSFPFASAYGNPTVQTPAFDLVAERGVLFTKAFCAAPQCSPSRAAILTGRNIWALEEAGTHSSYFPKKFAVFTDSLESVGYQLGFTGKPWGPGNWKDAGWDRNPVGPAYNDLRLDSVPYTGINRVDYAGNFKLFVDSLSGENPFFFWYGAYEPHRVYEAGSGLKAGKSLTEAVVPPFLPTDPEIKKDILDYGVEIEWFDRHLMEMISYLETIGELERTIIVVTADNGMAFPYAKANLTEFGTHVPLAIAGPGVVGGRQIDDLVSLIDLAPTFLNFAGLNSWNSITGRSLNNILSSDQSGMIDPARDAVYTGRERHTHARPDNLGYPSRAIRTHQYLYIQNYAPERWPAGNPPIGLKEDMLEPDFKEIGQGFNDIDNSPSKTFILDHRDSLRTYFELGFAKRPPEELYDVLNDPGCTNNLIGDGQYVDIQSELRFKLENKLKEEGDPRIAGKGDIFESYPRFGKMRLFAGFRTRGAYNKAYQQPEEN